MSGTDYYVLPEAIRNESLEQKIQRLKVFSPLKVEALNILATEALNDEWRARFHAGPRGGRMLGSQKKGGA